MTLRRIMFTFLYTAIIALNPENHSGATQQDGVPTEGSKQPEKVAAKEVSFSLPVSASARTLPKQPEKVAAREDPH